jgi:hypothetical protein
MVLLMRTPFHMAKGCPQEANMSEHDIDRQAVRFVVTQRSAATSLGAASRVAADGAVGGVSCRLGDASCASAHAASVSRSAGGQRLSMQRSLLQLQRQYGNRYVGQVLRQASAVEGDGSAMETIERSIDQARGGGQGMDHGTRARMESAFGTDFSGVRIHTDSRADTLSQSLSARAFTTGHDVFFRQGEYNPGTSSGRELLAHELTHVVQQNGDGIRRKMTVSQPGDTHEVEADQMARAVMQQEHAPVIDRQAISGEEDEEPPIAAKLAPDSLQRQPEAPTPQEEEEERLLTKPDSAVVSRQED